MMYRLLIWLSSLYYPYVPLDDRLSRTRITTDDVSSGSVIFIIIFLDLRKISYIVGDYDLFLILNIILP